MSLRVALLQLADGVISKPTGVMVGRWPRAAASLGRQSIEASLADYWQRIEPTIANTSMRAQLLALPVYLHDERLGRDVSSAWHQLPRACHYHPYELPPTEPELRHLLAVARRFATAVGTAVDAAPPGAHQRPI